MKHRIKYVTFFFFSVLLLITGKTSNAQTYECYIANDTFISTTQFEFDVLIKSTSTDFNLRTVQMAYTINPAFTPSGTAPTISYVAGSTQLVNYIPGNIQQNSTPSLSAFQVIVNIGVSCATGTLITTSPVRVCKLRIVSNSGPFNCTGHNLSMIRPSDPSAGGNVLLKMSISKWTTIDCSIPTSTTITNNGTFSNAASDSAYSEVRNLKPVITSQPTSVSTTCPTTQATFSVTATGNPGVTSSLTYQWLENGIAVNNGSTQGGNYAGATTPVLSITNATSLVNGNQYSCVVTQCNSNTSSAAVLTVFGISDNNACTIDGCDPVTGNVIHTPVITNDNNACTTDGCDVVTGVFHNALNIDDGNICTIDACNPVTASITHTPVNINDTNVCTTDGCDPITGVFHTPVVTNDNNGCTIDGCDPLTGIFHTPVNINDSNACTTDACIPANGIITHININSNDGNPCTTDGCNPLTGVFNNPINVDDNNACTEDACNPGNGLITHTNINPDDNNACTTDGCNPVSGVFNNPVNIDDGNLCTSDNCNPSTGIVTHTQLVTDDNNACTIDGCDSLTGVFHTQVSVDDGDPCTIDACNSVTGSITHIPSLGVNTLSTPASCSASDGTAIANPLGGYAPFSYLWSPGGQTTQSISSLPTGTYTVTVTDSSNCSAVSTVSVSGTSIAPPAPTSVKGPGGACRGQNGVVFSITPVPGASSYVWTLPAGATGVSVTSSITIDFNMLFNGGSICVSAVNNCGTSLSTCINIPVLVLTPAPPGILNGPSVFCPGDSAVFSVDPVSYATSYLWTVTGGLVIVSGQGSNSIVVSSPIGYVKGTVRVKPSNCKGSSGIRIKNVKGLPDQPILSKAPFGTVCSGTCHDFIVEDIRDATFWTFTAPSGSVITSVGAPLPGNPLISTSPIASICFPTGFVSGNVIVSAGNFCGEGSSLIYPVRSVPAGPAIISGPVNNLCNSTGNIYSIVPIQGALSYSWSIPAGAVITNNSGTSITVDYGSSFSTGVICVNANNGCGAGPKKCTGVKDYPSAPITINGLLTVCKSQTNVLYSVLPVNGASSYIWNISGGATITSGAGTDTIVVSFNSASVSTALLTVTAENACGSSLPKTILVNVNLNCRISEYQNEQAGVIQVFPNPASDYVNLTFYSEDKFSYRISLIDIVGKEMFNKDFLSMKGFNLIEMNLENYSKGFYFINIQKDGKLIQAIRLVVD